MVKPFLACASRSAKLRVTQKTAMSVEVPEVIVSFWENAKGARLGFATNWRHEPSELKISSTDGQTEIRRLAPLETIELR